MRCASPHRSNQPVLVDVDARGRRGKDGNIRRMEKKKSKASAGVKRQQGRYKKYWRACLWSSPWSSVQMRGCLGLSLRWALIHAGEGCDTKPSCCSIQKPLMVHSTLSVSLFTLRWGRGPRGALSEETFLGLAVLRAAAQSLPQHPSRPMCVPGRIGARHGKGSRAPLW